MADVPAEAFEGTLVFVVPHMDDEALACAGTMALLPTKERIHVVYATDGSRSPVPPFSRRKGRAGDLPQIRKAEAVQAMGVVGIPRQNLHFLGFPDGRLRSRAVALRRALGDALQDLLPDVCFIPFRYDRHPDHLALARASRAAAARLERPPRMIEYFVYYRWRLIPGGDVRRFVRRDVLIEIDTGAVAATKLETLACYRSQTAIFRSWQERPILPRERIESVAAAPELFVDGGDRFPGSGVLTGLRWWIPLAHRLEPFLKTVKEQARWVLKAGRRRRGT